MLHASGASPSSEADSSRQHVHKSLLSARAAVAAATAAAAAISSDARKFMPTSSDDDIDGSLMEKSRVSTVAAGIPRLTKQSPAHATDLTHAATRREQLLQIIRHPPTAETVDPSAFTDNSYITQLRAMSEYLLKTADLKECRIAYRRSPYSDKTDPVAVYWRKDVEHRAVEIWGSLDALRREKAQRKRRNDQQQRQLSALKKALRTYNTLKKYMSNSGASAVSGDLSAAQKRSIEATHSVVKSAILVNGLNTILKFFAWLFTNSHAMFAEMVHSFADLLNQIVLYIGILESSRK